MCNSTWCLWGASFQAAGDLGFPCQNKAWPMLDHNQDNKYHPCHEAKYADLDPKALLEGVQI